MKNPKNGGENPDLKLSKEELFAKLRASSERTLEALQKAYEAGMKEGLSDEEEGQLIESLARAKKLRDEILRMTSENGEHEERSKQNE